HDLKFRGRYFLRSGNTYQLNDQIRQQVHFHNGNILNRIFMEALGLYDIVFCRNVLIYLDAEAQDRAIANLERSLRPEGLLFVGHSEAGLFTAGPFVHSSHHPLIFVKRPANGEQQAPPARQPVVHDRKTPFEDSLSPPASSTIAIELPAADNLGRARKLADQGRLEESARLCEEHLEQHGPSAPACLLLGLIADIRGHQHEAVKLLRQAVYLDPDLQEALILLALIAERQGDKVGADRYRKRAQRLLKAGGGPEKCGA
ncbi:CheR family methyltransferase, partial [Desulfurivibrio sp. D14AmB]|uniref:CheR family methyltransferase n=1 Tax=Desulfurivibrio sp. D14AmB TaxID=3374370 RepID=UPI00376ECC9B